MDFAPGWQRDGGVRCSRADGRKAGSGSPSLSRRSTEAPDDIDAPAASPPARPRVRHSPLPYPWAAPSPRAPGHDLDGQPIGPTTDGTDRSEVPALRGGPQSSLPPTQGNLAPGHPGRAARAGYRYPGSARGLRGQLRRSALATSRLARCYAGARVSRGLPTPASASSSVVGDPRLSGRGVAPPAPQLSVLTLVLPVRPRGGDPARRAERNLVGRLPSRPLPSIPSRWLRSRPLMP
jgi:hypothetical protein